jgi:hypothetical protein
VRGQRASCHSSKGKIYNRIRLSALGQPGRDRGQTSAAGVDGWGWGARSNIEVVGRGAGAEPSLGNGNDDQDDEEPGPVASKCDRAGRG